MQITDILKQTGGLQSIARELGISESQAASGAAALAPAILGGFKKQAQAQPAGVEGLGGLLTQLGGGNLLDDVVSSKPTDVSRAVAQNASSQSGVEPGVLKKMLPMLAMLVAGYMARQQTAGAGAQASSGGGGLGGLLGGLLGGQGGGLGGLASMLDMDHDGNPLDDIIGMVAKRSQ